MKIKDVKQSDVPVEENEEEIENDIASVLLFTGYERNSDEWNTAMSRWKRRRSSNPRAYKKFMELD